MLSVQNVRNVLNSSFRVLVKGIWRDLVNIRRYKLRLIGWLLKMMIGLGAAYIFGVIFHFNPITTSETGILSTQVFVFFAGGIALSTFSDTALWAPLDRVQQDIHYGTLEAVFVTPTSRIAYLLSPIISDSIMNLLFFIPAYIIILGVHGALTNGYVLGLTMLVVLLTIVSMMAFGLFFAMLAILVRRIQSIAIFLANIFQFICGTFVPVQAFIGLNKTGGLVLKYFALIFPYTYCYDLFRYYMFVEVYTTLLPIWLEYLLLVITSLLFVGLAYLLLKRVEKKAKEKGFAIL
ncbi:MAG: ABC transporter permease [Asgard group archaeon]|nr:ABC transporter permease [Asgard group archaeon]